MQPNSTPVADSDDTPCTDCDGTGITIQTERRCACQPPLRTPTQAPEDGLVDLRALMERNTKANDTLAALHALYPDPAGDEDELAERGFRQAAWECDVSSALLSAAAAQALPALLARITADAALIGRLRAALEAIACRRSITFGACSTMSNHEAFDIARAALSPTKGEPS